MEDESIKPLANYRAEELERMKVNFFGADPSYHEARRRFVFKGNPRLRLSRLQQRQGSEFQHFFGHTIRVGAVASGLAKTDRSLWPMDEIVQTGLRNLFGQHSNSQPVPRAPGQHGGGHGERPERVQRDRLDA